VVVRHQDRTDPVHPQRGQFVQDRAAAEIDQHGLAPAAEHVDVTGIFKSI
jgi:hypothetical protein